MLNIFACFRAADSLRGRLQDTKKITTLSPAKGTPQAFQMKMGFKRQPVEPVRSQWIAPKLLDRTNKHSPWPTFTFRRGFLAAWENTFPCTQKWGRWTIV